MTTDFLKGQKVLIAGGAGLLGTAITKVLTDANVDVESSFFRREPPHELMHKYKKYDFTSFEDCLSATKSKNIVIICAVQAAGVKGILQSPTSTILPNLAIHAGLLEACVINKIEKVVWISSSSVYQEAFYPIREDQLNLNMPVYDLYEGIGWVYRYLEQLAMCYYNKHGLKVGIIRTSNIYGPFDRFDDIKSHVIPALIKRAVKKENPFIVWGRDSVVRDFIYVYDLVEGVLRTLKNYCVADPINISHGSPVSIGELVKVVLDTVGHKPNIIFDETKPISIPYRVLDNTKCDVILGHFPRTPLKEGIEATINWYLSEGTRE